MKILYFAWLKEKIGTAEEDVAPPPGVATVGDLVAWLRAQSPGHDAALADANALRMAVNQDMATADTPLSPADEVAFFPPMTGG